MDIAEETLSVLKGCDDTATENIALAEAIRITIAYLN
jgi:hypothetical protein